MAILLCLVQTASAVAAKSPEKTASGNFFTDPNNYTGETAPETQQLQWEIDLATTQSASGRQVWLSADPIGEAGGMNLYGYVGGNPLNRWDPPGLCWKDDFRRSSTWAGSAFGMGLGFLMGGGGGAVASVPTAGIAAIGTVPAGAIAGAAVGTAAGAVVGAAAAEAGIALADFASRWSDDSGDDGGGFCKMPQGDNTAKNKQFTDALKDLKIPKGSPLARKLHDAITGRGLGGFKDILKYGRKNGFQQ